MGSQKIPRISVAISCTVFTAFVVSGAIFSTYLLNKLDLLEAEVIIFFIILYIIYLFNYIIQDLYFQFVLFLYHRIYNALVILDQRLYCQIENGKTDDIILTMQLRSCFCLFEMIPII